MKKRYYDEEEYLDGKEVDLVDFIFIFIRRWKVIVLIMIPIIIFGFFFASTRPSLYKADTTLIVSNGMQVTGLENNDIMMNQRLVVTYSEIAKSRDVLRRVISKYDLQDTPDALAKKITVYVIKDTELIKLTYISNDPRLAEAVTNELAEEFIKKIGQVMKVRNVNVVEKAVKPSSSLPKGRGKILLISIILGGILGMGGAFFIEFIHKKIRKSSDIEKILGAQMLGMIPEIEIINKGEDKHES